MGGTSPLSTAATIDRLSAVPVRNVLRYVSCSKDYDAITGAFRNFHAVGRTPAAVLQFHLNNLRRSIRDYPGKSGEEMWDSFFPQELQQMWRALRLRNELGPARAPPSVPRDPFDGVYGTLEAMMTRDGDGKGVPTVADYPEWSDVLAYKLPAGGALVYRSPEFCLQVLELARLLHGDECRSALANRDSATRMCPISHRFHNARIWPAGYTLLLRYAMVALDMVGANATHLLPYIYCSPPLLEAYVLNGSDIFEQEEVLKVLGIADENHRTLLSIAILKAQPRVVKALLEYRKVDVTAHHNQALAAACSMGHMELAKALVAFGADLNDVGGGGHGYALPINFAAAMRDATLLDDFLALGAEPNISGREGEALFLAVGAVVRTDLQGFHDFLRHAGPDGAPPLPIAYQLMRRGFVLGPLRDATFLLAAYSDNSKIMLELFKHKPMRGDQDAIDTALCIASLTLNLETIRFLATLGADMNCRKAIGGGHARSPLGWAMRASGLPDRRDMARLLTSIDLLTRLGADANDAAILDEFLVAPLTQPGDTQPAEFVEATRARFLLLARGGSDFRQYVSGYLPPFPTDCFRKFYQSDDVADDDGAVTSRLLTAEEKAYDCAEFEDEDYPWGTLFRALLVRGMDPYTWPEKHYFEHLKEWGPSTIKVFKEKRWKQRHNRNKNHKI
ncbi:hypothetical protein HDU88_009022 [Geranomyces variabilis]|nr:hypothetical protein HDU88_009022 [Geranomyces variabilis]